MSGVRDCGGNAIEALLCFCNDTSLSSSSIHLPDFRRQVTIRTMLISLVIPLIRSVRDGVCLSLGRPGWLGRSDER